MKTKYFITTLLLLTIFITQGQIYYGFKVGANYSNLGGDVENNAYKAAMHFGGVAEYEYNDLLSFQGEVTFSFQGLQNKDDSEFKTNLNYVNVAVVGKYFVSDYITIDAGPQFGYLLSAKNALVGDESIDVIDNFKSIDYGVLVGATYEFDYGIFISLRYNLGLANISNLDSFKTNNSVAQLSLGYKFY